MSPSELRRTTRNFGSGMRRLANRLEKIARRVILGVTNNSDANAKAGCDSSFGNGLCRVIRALGMDVGTRLFEERFDVGFNKKHDVIYAAEGGHELCARAFVENWPAGPLLIADAGISVHANDQNIAFATGAFKIADMPDVQRIEAAVREDDAPALALVFHEFLTEHFSRHDFGSGFAHDSAGGS